MVLKKLVLLRVQPQKITNMKEKKALGYIWYLWGSAAILAGGVFLSVRYFPLILKNYTHAQSVVGLGEYGDIYGGLNTLFTGFAFVGLLVTIFLQHLELKETRDEFEKQTKQFEAQTRLLNEQIDEQKDANKKQFHLALDAQKKEELFKRLEIIKALEKDVCIDDAYAAFSGVWSRLCVGVLHGDAAFEIFFLNCTDFLYFLNSTTPPSKVQVMQLSEQQNSLYVTLNRLNAWLYSIYDYVHDIPIYFNQNPSNIGMFYRLLFNSSSKYAESVLLMSAGQIIPDHELIEAKEKGYILATNVLPIHLDSKAKELLWKYVNKDITVDAARREWQCYIQQSGVEYESGDYVPRRPKY